MAIGGSSELPGDPAPLPLGPPWTPMKEASWQENRILKTEDKTFTKEHSLGKVQSVLLYSLYNLIINIGMPN